MNLVAADVGPRQIFLREVRANWRRRLRGFEDPLDSRQSLQGPFASRLEDRSRLLEAGGG